MTTAEEISITIDGVPVKTAPGKMVLEAAIEAGIYVPFLCYHPLMKPFAACRMCVVEVEGGRGTPASCTLPVQDGMVIKNNTHQVYQLRRSIMELLISEHPHGCLTCHRVDLCGPQDICLRHVSVNDRCVTCPKNERCELKDTTRALNMSLESPLPYKYRNLPIETGDPFYDRDYNLCIVCGRCVRVCEEVRGDNAITFTERAGQALVGTSHGTSLLESGCEFCGACLDVCPVGALVESDHKWEKARRVEKTVCPHCPVGCQLNLEVNRFEKIVRSVPELYSPANRGQACFKGKFGLDFVNRKERLTVPLVRRNGHLEEATWDEALSYITDRLPAYKGDSFAILTSPNSTNEEHYLAQKFARVVMGTNNVDQSSDTRPELLTGLQETVGYAAATNTIWELESSSCILAFNTNITEEHNVAAVPIKRAVKGDTRLIVIDPREVELTRYAHLWLRPRPGTELLVLGGLLKVIIEESLIQKEWIEEHCQGHEALIQAVGSIDLEVVAQTTGVSKENMEEAARVYATSGASSILYALDNVAEEIQRDCVYSLVNLALLTGNVGKPSTGLYPLRQGANEQGAWDLGCVPHMLPGYQPVDDSQARQTLEGAWDTALPVKPGLNLRGVAEAVNSGGLKAMYVIGDGPYLRDGGIGSDLSGDAQLWAEGLEFLIVQDTFLSHIAQRAHVVLPRVTFAEKAGTYTNLERRIQLLHPVVQAKNSEAQPEWWTLCQLGKRMGAGGFDFESPAQVMQEIAIIVPLYHGVSHDRIEAEAITVLKPDFSNPMPTQLLYSQKEHRGLLWPCSDANPGGTSILYTDGFPHGKARITAPEFRTSEGPTDGEYPFLLVPGRVLLQSDREMEVVKGKLNHIKRDEVVEIHPENARELGIEEGDLVAVSTRESRFQGRVQVVPNAQRGVVSSTSLFGQLAVELQASEAPDPMVRVPGLPITPARVDRVTAS